MGKIVKFCNACEESFAEKFGFCPICGETLRAFEMNPIDETAKTNGETESVPVERVGTEEATIKTEQEVFPETEHLLQNPLKQNPLSRR